MDNLKIDVPSIPKEELIESACTHYNNRIRIREEYYREWASQNHEEVFMEEDSDFKSANPDSNFLFLSRICLNFLRHRMTDYEKILTGMGGKSGKDEVYDKLKQKVNGAIFDKYEWLHRDVEIIDTPIWSI